MDWLFPEGIYTAVMMLTFVAGTFILKMPIAVAMALAAVAGALVSGNGLALRHLIEGAFGYLDTILIIATAMIFMKTVEHTGLLETVALRVIRRFKNAPVLLTFSIVAIIMFPGMITGSSTAAVLTSGALVAPIIMRLGVPRDKAAAAIAMAAIYGMAAPPVNIPAMIIGGGIDMPYVGFGIPLLICTVPLAAITGLMFILPALRKSGSSPEREAALKETLAGMDRTPLGFRILLPFITLVVLLVGEIVFPQHWPQLGMPLSFFLAALTGLLSGRNWKPVQAATEAVKDALPVMGILIGVGMFIQIMTLNGVRGFFVVSVLALPAWLVYVGIATSMPLFGAVSAFGSATVLGVPFLLALLGNNEIMVGSALSLMAGLGDLMPPTALAGIFAAQVVGEDNYFKVLKHCFIPAMLTAVWGIVIILLANRIAAFI